jgi:hypothetical protein
MTRPAFAKRCNNRPATINLFYPRFPIPAQESARPGSERFLALRLTMMPGVICGGLAA